MQFVVLAVAVILGSVSFFHNVYNYAKHEETQLEQRVEGQVIFDTGRSVIEFVIHMAKQLAQQVYEGYHRLMDKLTGRTRDITKVLDLKKNLRGKSVVGKLGGKIMDVDVLKANSRSYWKIGLWIELLDDVREKWNDMMTRFHDEWKYVKGYEVISLFCTMMTTGDYIVLFLGVAAPIFVPRFWARAGVNIFRVVAYLQLLFGYKSTRLQRNLGWDSPEIASEPEPIENPESEAEQRIEANQERPVDEALDVGLVVPNFNVITESNRYSPRLGRERLLATNTSLETFHDIRRRAAPPPDAEETVKGIILELEHRRRERLSSIITKRPLDEPLDYDLDDDDEDDDNDDAAVGAGAGVDAGTVGVGDEAGGKARDDVADDDDEGGPRLAPIGSRGDKLIERVKEAEKEEGAEGGVGNFTSVDAKMDAMKSRIKGLTKDLQDTLRFVQTQSKDGTQTTAV